MAVNEYAIIDGNEVVNIILLDEANEYTPPTGHILVPTEDNVGIGWQRIGTEWVAPAEQETSVEPVEDPDVTAAKQDAVQELMAIGISEATARRILSLPVDD
ncbi:hypothetical protein PP914_gp035 [Arthrobacter phage Qui]|jgi:hypothetical protein|uniref:Uncharacterized protein n=1 Tax=Arthrobacter phage Qui TaxID=2603260 RepID=A0A5B8WK91_9CAUD|nr:hypothetical protein PP914_gp035 [Arthrobacter phage Qui]QED11525.1 hypothetical protein SEA_QUI_35 [Arthrobacter phage Qui]QOC56357.1 hypothetical protein SEA_PAELLA_35 [Arthrobacter phage Paella]